MKIAFVMDPVETINPSADTTFALMRASAERGANIFHVAKDAISLRHDEVWLRASEALVNKDSKVPVSLSPPISLPADNFDAIWIRPDPPFDDHYLWLTQILDLCRHAFVINKPSGLRAANEKLFTHHFAEFMPKTLVSSSKSEILEFLKDECGGKAVGKPVDGHGGGGIFLLADGDFNLQAGLETLTQDFRNLTVIQEFLPAVSSGDKRVLLLDGHPLGAINRVPKSGEFRSNLHVGGSAKSATITAEEKIILETIAPTLRENGLFFVGIDIVGGKMTEINVTSPTGIQEMSRFDQVDYAKIVFDWVKEKLN